MAGINYIRLFSVRLTHNFYASGICNGDFEIRPTSQTLEVMKNYKLVFKNDDQGFRVYYKANDNNTSFISISHLDLHFGMYLKNKTGFMNFTNLKSGSTPFSAGKIAYFSNKGSGVNVTTNALTYSIIGQVQPKIYNIDVPEIVISSNSNLYVDVSNYSDVDVTPGGSPFEIPFPSRNATLNLQHLPSGLYKVHSFDGIEVDESEYIFFDDELAGQELFGIIDIHVNDAANIDDDPTSGNINTSLPGIPGSQPTLPIPPFIMERVYDVRFARQVSKWRYIVVLKSGSYIGGNIIRALDEGGSQAEYGALTFGASAAGTYEGMNTKIISSTGDPIPYFETPKTGLSIVKYPSGSEASPGGTPDTIITNIPIPSPYGSIPKTESNVLVNEILVFI